MRELLSREFDKIKAIKQLNFSFRLGKIPGRIEMEPRLYRHRAELQFGWPTGFYRKLWLHLDSAPLDRQSQLIVLYYGPWRKSNDRYISLVKKPLQTILIELGFTKRSHSVVQSTNGKVVLRHLMRYSKRSIGQKRQQSLISRALGNAEKLGLSVNQADRSIILGEINSNKTNHDKAVHSKVLKRLILSAVSKRSDDLFGAVKRGANRSVSGKMSKRKLKNSYIWPPATDPIYNNKVVRFEINLDSKAKRHKLHQRIINFLKEELDFRDFDCQRTPEDLRAVGKNGKSKWIFEVKAWDPDLETASLWHAIGQVRWYCFRKANGFNPAVVLAHRPKERSVEFLEDYCGIPLLWVDVKKKSLYGGKLARKYFKL